jgi:hypothetical protein
MLTAASTAPKPRPKTTMPQANIHSDGATASAARATAVSAVPVASSEPADSRGSRRPLMALAITVAVMPKASRMPRAATG